MGTTRSLGVAGWFDENGALALSSCLLLILAASTWVLGPAAMVRWEFLGATHTLLVATVMRLRGRTPADAAFADVMTWIHMGPSFVLVADASRTLADGRLDAALSEFDVRLFGQAPARWFDAVLPSDAAHEWLAFAYFCHYLLIPGAMVAAHRAGPRFRRRAVHTLVLGYCIATCWELLQPTRGLLPERASTVRDSGTWKALVDWVYRFDAHGGAAFPSSHVAMGTLWWWILVVVWPHPAARLITSTIFASMMVATLQGSFHYALDIPAGFFVGAATLVVIRPGATLRRASAPAR